MKIALLTGKEQFAIRHTDEPVCPDDGFILNVEACAICGSDLRRWREGSPLGIVPGHEIAGIAVEIGKNCTQFNVGDHIAVGPDIHCGSCYFCQRGRFNLCDNLKLLGITPGFPGGAAEKMVISKEVIQNGIIHKMPDGLSFNAASLAEPCCSVIASHERAGTTIGDTVLIQGAGPIGCIHIAVAKKRGADVIISEPSETRRKIAQQFEPELIIDPVNEHLNEKILNFTNNIGVDIVISANPVASTQTQAVEVVRKGGKVLLFGGLPKVNPMTSLDGNRIHYGEIEVIGTFSYHPRHHELALDLLKRDIIPSDLLITNTFSLDDIQQGYQLAADGNALKVVINP